MMSARARTLILSPILFVLLAGVGVAQPAWRRLGSLLTPRSECAAIPIARDRVLVIGGAAGQDRTPTSSCEIIDLENQTIVPAAPMAYPRSGHVALATPDSSVIAISGRSQGKLGTWKNTPTIERFDRVRGTWETLGELRVARRGHAAAFLDARHILVVGGRDDAGAPVASAEIFDLGTGTSRMTASYPLPIADAAIGRSDIGDILVGAGRVVDGARDRSADVYRYDLLGGSWIKAGQLVASTAAGALLTLRDGRMAIIGGSDGDVTAGAVPAVQVEKQNRWTSLCTLREARISPAAGMWSGDSILVIGGTDALGTPRAECQWLDLRSGSSMNGPSLPRARTGAVVLPFDGPLSPAHRVGRFLLAIGGTGADGRQLGAVEILEPPSCDAEQPFLVTSRFPTICLGETVTLKPSRGYRNYRWSTGETTPSIDVDKPGRYWVSVTDSNGCTATSAMIEVIVSPRPAIDAGADISICPGDSTLLSGWGEGKRRWLPAATMSCLECDAPVVHPSRTASYILSVTNDEGCTVYDTVMVFVAPTNVVKAHIDRSLAGKPGDVIRVPVVLDDPLTGARVTRLRFALRYDSTVMRLSARTQLQIGSITRGTLLEGWYMNVLEDRPGLFRVELTAPSFDRALVEKGTLFRLNFRSFVTLQSTLQDAFTSELPFELEFTDANCSPALSVPGLVTFTVCGARYRSMEILAGDYTLKQNAPNPFNPTTDIPFSLGFEGHATLEVLDARGRRVALLVDDDLQPGSYAAPWDAEQFPSGIYYYRLLFGEWIETRRMDLVK